MTKISEQLAPQLEPLVQRWFAQSTPCDTTISDNTYCLTRGGDVVFHYSRPVQKNGRLAAFTQVSNLRTGEEYTIFVGGPSNGKAHFHRPCDHLDVVMCFHKVKYPAMYTKYSGGELDGPKLLKELQSITSAASFQNLPGVAANDELKRVAQARALLAYCHTAGHFQPAVRLPQWREDEDQFGSRPEKEETKMEMRTKEEIAVTTKASVLVQYQPSIRMVHNENFAKIKISMTPAKNGGVHLAIGPGVNRGWEDRVAALSKGELSELIANLTAVRDIL